MDVGSPENGFDEISDLLKDDGSTLPEDLDLSFLLNKDIASDYVYDELESDDKFNFHFSEQGQSELPTLMSNFKCYDTPGHLFENFHSSARTGCSSDVLTDTDADVLYNKGPSEFRSPESWENDYTEKLCAGYLRDSDSQVDLSSIDDGPVDVFRHPQLVASLQDTNLEKVMDRGDSTQNNGIDEVTFSERLPPEPSQSDFRYKEEDHDVPVHQIEKLQLSPSSYRGDVESKSEIRNSGDGNKEFDSFSVNQQGTSFCAIHLVPQYQSLSASYGLQDASYPNTSHEQECCGADSVDPTLDHSLHTSVENSVSSPGSWQRSQYTQDYPAKHVATPEIKSSCIKRSMPQSPVRQRDSSSSYKRICHSNSETRSPSIRGWHERSSETAACSHQSPGSSTRHVFGEGHSRSQEHKHERTDCGREVTSKENLSRTGSQNPGSPQKSSRWFKNSSPSRRSPASSRTHSSSRSGQGEMERSDSASPVWRRDLHAGNKRERDKSRSRSPQARDHSRIRYLRRKTSSRSCSSHHRSSENRYSSPASSRRSGRPGTCLFVAGFAFSTTESELKRKFSRYGHVRNVRVIRDRRSGISRGYGFLTLERDEEADAAIRALHRTDWNGRIVLVEKSYRC